ncbi:MAG: hypothetical protein ACKO4U_17930 [Caldilinea sp.]
MAVGMSVGTVAVQGLGGVLLLRGAGACRVKSAPLFWLSVQPPPPRRAALVFDNRGAGAPSDSLAPP